MDLPPELPRLHLTTVVHRVVRTGRDPLSIEGSLKGGGRYNPRGEFAVLYTSFDEATAISEVLRRAGVKPDEYPVGFYRDYELEVQLEAVLDLTDSAVLSSLSLEKESLTGADLSLTQELARKARSAGFQGMLVPSATEPHSKNVVIFVDSLERLPKVIRSKPVRY